MKKQVSRITRARFGIGDMVRPKKGGRPMMVVDHSADGGILIVSWQQQILDSGIVRRAVREMTIKADNVNRLHKAW